MCVVRNVLLKMIMDLGLEFEPNDNEWARDNMIKYSKDNLH